jgi:hypothetical protein
MAEKKYMTDSITVTSNIVDSLGATGTNGQVLSSTGNATEWVDSSGGTDADYFRAPLLSLTTINSSLTMSEYAVIGSPTNNNGGWTSTSTLITPASVGIYEVSVMCYYTGSVTRANVGMTVAIDGVFDQPIAAMGYLRNSSGHNESSLTFTSLVEIEINSKAEMETISIGFQRLAAAGTITIDGAKSGISIIQIA